MYRTGPTGKNSPMFYRALDRRGADAGACVTENMQGNRRLSGVLPRRSALPAGHSEKSAAERPRRQGAACYTVFIMP